MATTPASRDRLDEVLAEIEDARAEARWVPSEERSPKRLVSTPEVLSQGRWTPSRSVVILMVLLALCALSIFGLRVMLARDADAVSSGAGPTVNAANPTQSAGATPGVSASVATSGGVPASAPAVAPATPATWSVHVVGAVNRPGVVTVKSGARVADAIGAAGGMTNAADSTAINLARPVSDGEQIHVPKPGEKWEPPSDAGPAPAATPGAPMSGASPNGAGAGPASSSAGNAEGTINLNTATLEQLDSLPGVGPVLAQRILDWRTEHGTFSTVDELGEVSGIGDKVLARLRPKVTV